jgi:hypothetical protein
VYRLGSLLRLTIVGCALALLPFSLGHADERRGEELFALLAVAPEAQLEEVRAGTAAGPDLPPLTTSVILWDEARPPAPPVRNTAEHASVTGQMNTYQR